MSDPITSRQNQWVRRFRDALENHDEEFVIEGKKQVDDARALAGDPIAILASPKAGPPPADAIVVSDEIAKWISGTRTPQGVFALFRKPRHSVAEIPRSGPVVVLDSVQDPGNVGTIVRLSVAFDAAGLILLPGTASPWAPKALRAAAGAAALRLPMVEIDLPALEAEVAARSARLLAADPEGGAMPAPGGVQDFIVFGSEGAGLSEGIARTATRFSIPFSRNVESLNVASAAAIVLSRLWEGGRKSEE